MLEPMPIPAGYRAEVVSDGRESGVWHYFQPGSIVTFTGEVIRVEEVGFVYKMVGGDNISQWVSEEDLATHDPISFVVGGKAYVREGDDDDGE